VERPNVRESCASLREAWLISLIHAETQRVHTQRREALRNLGVLRAELESVAVMLGHPANALPSLAVLRANGRHDLVDAIHSCHGGVSRVCRLLGIRRVVRRSYEPVKGSLLASHASAGVTKQQSNVATIQDEAVVDDKELERSLLHVARAAGTVGRIMPNDEELRDAGRKDLRYAVRKRGGYRAVASQLGLRLRRKGSMTKYADANVLKRDLRSFMKQVARERHEALAAAQSRNDTEAVKQLEALLLSGGDDVLPSLRELRSAGRRDLINAIKSHGGLNELARKLNLRMSQQALRDATSATGEESGTHA